MLTLIFVQQNNSMLYPNKSVALDKNREGVAHDAKAISVRVANKNYLNL